MRSSQRRSAGVLPARAKCGRRWLYSSSQRRSLMVSSATDRKGRAAVEFFFVGSMTTFDFAVTLRAPRRDVAMGNPEIAQMPREVGPERAAVVGLDALNSDGQSAPDLFDEGDRV